MQKLDFSPLNHDKFKFNHCHNVHAKICKGLSATYSIYSGVPDTEDNCTRYNYIKFKNTIHKEGLNKDPKMGGPGAIPGTPPAILGPETLHNFMSYLAKYFDYNLGGSRLQRALDVTE